MKGSNLRPAAPSLHDCVSAIVYALAEEHARLAGGELTAPYNEITATILAQLERMPAPLDFGMKTLVRAFDWRAVARGGGRFSGASLARRQNLIEQWRRSPLGVHRDFVKFFESFVALALYSRLNPARPSRVPSAQETGTLVADARCEVVVIGSGPGGSITACLLAEAGKQVCLIEEGPFLQLDSCAPFSLQELEQKYRSGGATVAFGANKISYVEGRCVGGGSEVNSGLYHRTPSEVLARWRQDFGVEALTDADLVAHFAACEADVSVSSMQGAMPLASLKLHDGASRLGWKSLEVPRWFRYEGAAGSNDAPRGVRQSMTQTYVPRFLRAGGRLQADTFVERMQRDGGRWTVQARHRTQGNFRLTADAVFVCGGAVQSAALLRRSGITTNVGNSLRMHPTAKFVAEFNETVNGREMGVPVHQVKEFAPRFSFGCSISSPPYLAMGLLDHPAARPLASREWNRLAVYYAMITGKGSGTVRAIPGLKEPLVRYRLTAQDRADLGEGLRKLGLALFESGAQTLYPAFTGARAVRSADELLKLPAEFPSGAHGVMTIHLFSSCPMGERKEVAAVDSFGRVHGHPGLHVSDGSILCGAPGVNPQGTIMALARRNALHFLGKL